MNKLRRCLVGLLLLALLGAACFASLHAGLFGLSVFVVSPVALGGIAAWTFQPDSGAVAAGFGVMAVLVACGAFLALGQEGLICIAMALPLAAPLGALGGWIAFRVSRSHRLARGAVMLLLLPPAGLTWDKTAQPPVYELSTSIVIAASPEQVWKRTIAVSEIPEPGEWFFRAGLAYPKGARLMGPGVGATRYCDFSTGSAVETIDAWDEPRMFRFRVIASPAPMHELSPYGDIQPRHLHGYLVSRAGEFRMIRLDNRHTMLVGTSWYQHGLWPAHYWRWWSDAIIHRIHLRVMNQIREQAEADAAAEHHPADP